MTRKILSLIILSALFITPACKKGSETNKNDSPIESVKNLPLTKGDRTQAMEINARAMVLYKQEKYNKAESLWVKAAELDPSWWKPFFNMACIAALRGEHDLSFDYLELAIQRDKPKVLSFMKTDADLKSIRGLERYKSIMSKHIDPVASIHCPEGKAVVLKFNKSYSIDVNMYLNFESIKGEKYSFTHVQGDFLDDEFKVGHFYNICYAETPPLKGEKNNVLVIVRSEPNQDY